MPRIVRDRRALSRAEGSGYPGAGIGRDDVRETYHIEVLWRGGREAEVVQRRSVRSGTLAPVRERALDLFRRSRTPQSSGPRADAGRVIHGAGTERFSWTETDEVTGGRCLPD